MMPSKAKVLNCVFTILFSCSTRPVWGPPIYLWLTPRSDTLGLTSRCNLLPPASLFREALYETLSCNPRRLSSWNNPVYGTKIPAVPVRVMKSRTYATISSAHQCSALKALHAVLNEGGLESFISRLLLLSRCVDMCCSNVSKVRAF